MRGNLELGRRELQPAGSIPAHAGEPRARGCQAQAAPVYPRTCGGTVRFLRSVGGSTGLSPHMRGNLDSLDGERPALGSIPAHAGEPVRRSGCGSTETVYPRTCGGTKIDKTTRETRQGLSPHMRGNPSAVVLSQAVSGSIPAHAGEPLAGNRLAHKLQVYPRTCGGTTGGGDTFLPFAGLSPHMRGNRSRQRAGSARRRSIPAHAGEPHTCQLVVK